MGGFLGSIRICYLRNLVKQMGICRVVMERKVQGWVCIYVGYLWREWVERFIWKAREKARGVSLYLSYLARLGIEKWIVCEYYGCVNEKILIVEDDTQLLSVYSKVLSMEGYQIVTAVSGKQALEVAKKEIPSLVLLDIMLPEGMNGFDVLEQLKQDEKLKSVPVLVLTNLDSEEKSATLAGASGYVIKANMMNEELVNKVRNMI